LAKEEQRKSAERDQSGYLSRAPAPTQQPQAPPPAMAAAPMPVPASASPAPPAPHEMAALRGKASKQQVAAPVQSVQSAGDVEALRKKFDEAARASRYDEAVKLFQELEKRTNYLTPTERALYVRCLMATGRQDRAQQALDDLKADKRYSNAQLQQVESELNNARRRTESSKKAAKKPMAAPADRSAEQRVAEPAAPPPAEPTPPDSTHTKVPSKPASSY
jgi:hypothetical protein